MSNNANQTNNVEEETKDRKWWVYILLGFVALLVVVLSVIMWNLAGPQPMTVLTQKDFPRR